MVLDKLINEYYDRLSYNDLHIIKIVHDYTDKMKSMKIQELASLSHTSTSSIHRLSRKLGFDGYSDLKAFIKLNASSGDTTQDLMKLLDHDIQQTFNHLNQLDFDYLNQLIDTASHIYIYGTGTAQIDLASDVQRHFLSVRKKSMVLRNKLELLRGVEVMEEDELLLIISLSGDTKNFDEIIQLIKAQNINYISVTTLRDNKLAQNAMFNIYVNSTPFQLYSGIENSSFLPYYIVFDVIVRKYSLWKENQKARE